jgi:hypothetical protein
MKQLLVLAIILSCSAWSQDKIDILDLCEKRSVSTDLVFVDGGFCDEYLKAELKTATTTLDPKCPGAERSDKWKLRLYMSHSFTTYFNTNISLRSSRYQLEIKDYQWAERSSREFFLPSEWKKPGHNPGQFIDEPTNTFTLSIEKDGNEFFLSAFHPKFLQAKNQIKHMEGTIDGTPVNGIAPINKPFDGYDQVPGESELVGNQNTYREMNFEIGYGKRFKLLDSKFGSITYAPSLAAGIITGQNTSIVVKPGEWWEFDGYTAAYAIQGYGGSLKNRIEFNTKKERFGVFYENKLSLYHQEHAFLDGTQEYNLGFMANNVGLKFMIYNPKNHNKKVPKT